MAKRCHPVARRPACGLPVLFLVATMLLEAVVLLAIVHQVPTCEATNVIHEQKQQQQQASSPDDDQQQAPAIISWDAYRRLFNKQYSSISQQLIRQKIFISKTMQVFMSAVKYRLNQASCYLAINKFSDLDQAEASRILAGDSSSSQGADDDDDPEADFMDDERVRQLLEQEDSDDDDDEQEDDDDHRAANSRGRSSNKRSKRRRRPAGALSGAVSRTKRSTQAQAQAQALAQEEEAAAGSAHRLLRQLSFKDLIRLPKAGDGHSDSETPGEHQSPAPRYKWFVPSSNPDYEPMEQASMASSGGGGSNTGHSSRKAPPRDIPVNQVDEIEQEAKRSQHKLQSILGKASSWPGQAASNVLHAAFKWFAASSPAQASAEITALAGPAATGAAKFDSPQAASGGQTDNGTTPGGGGGGDTRVHIDWRQSGCISPPIDQGDCNSCYAISTMAFVEWKLCMFQSRQLTPLSPQYMVSCGVQLKRESNGRADFNGCDRGYSKHSTMFIESYGVELETNMPYLAQLTDCPVAPHTPLKRKGYIRPNVKDTVRMLPGTSQLDFALQKGPVIVSFLEPMNFLDYGGGMVDNCHQRGGHAMLIVGSGVENGVDYLLIKNSFGTSWGMNGYFKFKRASIRRCVKQFIFVKLSFPGKKAQARRVKAYLAELEKQDYLWNEQELPNINIEQYFDVGAGGLFS